MSWVVWKPLRHKFSFGVLTSIEDQKHGHLILCLLISSCHFCFFAVYGCKNNRILYWCSWCNVGLCPKWCQSKNWSEIGWRWVCVFISPWFVHFMKRNRISIQSNQFNCVKTLLKMMNILLHFKRCMISQVNLKILEYTKTFPEHLNYSDINLDYGQLTLISWKVSCFWS